jgi:hypothetical protein
MDGTKPTANDACNHSLCCTNNVWLHHEPLYTKLLSLSETMETTYPLTKHHIQEEWSPQGTPFQELCVRNFKNAQNMITNSMTVSVHAFLQYLVLKSIKCLAYLVLKSPSAELN